MSMGRCQLFTAQMHSLVLNSEEDLEPYSSSSWKAVSFFLILDENFDFKTVRTPHMSVSYIMVGMKCNCPWMIRSNPIILLWSRLVLVALRQLK
jgi:hypothetical protein